MNFGKIDKKWQKIWETKKNYKTIDKTKSKKNFMLLVEFPYPSGDLHIGHWYAYAVPDILARYLKMKGNNVMYPIGFDAFGLPAENAAIKRKINPAVWTENNIKFMTKQLKSMGASFDWSRVISTIDHQYYKWTQWIFLKMYQKGLAYRAKTMVNWCPNCKTVLANEQVIAVLCERCDSEVIQKKFEQWMFRITDYADRLIDDIKDLDWPQTTKLAQKNWIGRSEGVIVKFDVKCQMLNVKCPSIEVFTTRLDTIFGCTYLVLAPERVSALIQNSEFKIQNSGEVENYINQTKKKTELQRLEIDKEKTGVKLEGIKAINPFDKEEVPIFVADYVLGHYGTGAVMAVPAHDERDKEFAQKFSLPVSSAPLEDAKKIVEKLKDKKLAEFKKNYKLHDWVLSRQRYWGVPIPMIHCDKCGYQPVPEKGLPVKLPDLEDFKPTDDGRSPLAKAENWVNVKCPKCGQEAKRETDTMDTFVDSSWYFLRYADPKNKKEFADKKKLKSWLPVPLYIGGAEHNTMHLLYSRFVVKALHDLRYLDFSEPYLTRRNHGVVLDLTGQKMSKSKGNAADPDKEVAKYGADSVRMYLAFAGPYDQNIIWSAEGLVGIFRFLNRVWNFIGEPVEPKTADKEVDKILNKFTKEIGDDIKDLKFNTGVSGLMKLLNAIEDKWLTRKQYETFLKLLAPFAPHLAEEIWMEVLEHKKSIHLESWPEYDEKYLQEETVDLVVQINGKTRDVLKVARGLDEEEVKSIVLNNENIKKHLADKEIKKFI